MTIFNSPSGTGKTSFLNSLYQRLTWDSVYIPIVKKQARFLPQVIGKRKQKERALREQSLKFEFVPSFETTFNASIGYIPQHAPKVKHWKAEEILPSESMFLDCLFPDPPQTVGKRIGQFSGGQRSKLYCCSALERLRHLKPAAAFLLLDETLDGLGVKEAVRCLTAIKDRWLQRINAPLYILLVSHLEPGEWNVLNPTFLRLAVIEDTEAKMVVEVAN